MQSQIRVSTGYRHFQSTTEGGEMSMIFWIGLIVLS